MTDLKQSYAKPFDLQIAALRLRLANQVGTAAWDDLIKSQHDRAFVVAGAMKADLLADLGRAVEKAIGEHRSIEKFREEFRQIVADRGWHGWTGEGTAKGEAWRTKVIYRTNMATSYAAGRFAQLKAAGYKFWVYKHGNALEPRLQHLAWDGVALPPDHPFWETHAPPNGWGCTCRIRGADSERGIKRAGGDPAKTLPDGWDATNAKTGEPDGIDKGWGYAPGASAADEIQTIAEKLPKWPAPIGAAAAAAVSQKTATALGRQFELFVDTSLSTFVRNEYMIIGALKPDWVKAAEAQGVQVATAEIAVSDKQVQHAFRGTPAVTVKGTKQPTGQKPKAAPLDLVWYKGLPKHLLAPRAVLLDLRHGDPVFLLVFDRPNSHAWLVVEINTYLKKAGKELNSIVSGRSVDLRAIRATLGTPGNKVMQIEGAPF